MNFKKLILLINIVFFTVTCQQKKKINDTSVNEIPVKLIDVNIGSLDDRIFSSGLVTTGKETNLSFKTSGIIRKMYVEEGDVVTKGMLLAELDFTEITAGESQVRENYRKALREYQRMKNLYDEKVITLEILENSKTVVDVIQESLNMINFDKKHSIIRAPSNGVILNKYVNENEMINTGTPVLLMNNEDLNNFIIKINVTAQDRFKIKLGGEVKINIEVYPETEFKGKIKHINGYVDKNSGLYTLDVQLDHQDLKLEEGMFATTEIITSNVKQYSIIPITAISDGDINKANVFIPDQGNKVKKIQVKVALIKDGNAYIESGLENVTHIINEGAGFISENSIINIK